MVSPMPRIAEVFSEPMKLLTLPEVYLRIRRLIDDPNAGVTEIAAAIALDPALSAQFLKIANSPLYRGNGETTTVANATARLGTQLIHDIVLTAAVAGLFQKIPPQLMDVRQYWRNAVTRGVLAQTIAAAVGVLDNEHVFVEGLLSGIGQLALYQRFPLEAAQALAEAITSGRPLHEVERQIFGFDYCDVGGLLAQRWGLPAALCACVQHHQQPDAATAYQLEVAIVHTAARLADNAIGATLALAPKAVSWTAVDLPEATELYQQALPKVQAILNTFGDMPLKAAA